MSKRTESRLFITVSGLGVCGEDGRNTSVSYSFKKRLGDREKPISTLFVPLIEEALQLCRWPSEEALIADLTLLVRYAKEKLDNETKAAAKAADMGGNNG